MLRMTPCILMLACVLAPSGAAEIYRWVDEGGRVHFTDKPPPSRGTKVEIQTRQPPDEPDAGEVRRLELLTNAEIDRAHRERSAAYEAANVEQESHAAECERARHGWYVLVQRMPVYWTEQNTLRAHWAADVYEGERRYVDDEDRPALIAQTEREIATYCAEFDETKMQAGYDDFLRGEWCEVYKVKLGRALDKKSRTPQDEVEAIREQVRRTCG